MNTGDPTIDGLLSWLTNGGHLTSPGAVVALALIVKTFLLPVLARICTRFKFDLNGPLKLHAVFAVAILVVFIVNITSHARLHLGDVITLGVQVGITAVGIHESVTALQAVSLPRVSLGTLTTLKGPDKGTA